MRLRERACRSGSKRRRSHEHPVEKITTRNRLVQTETLVMTRTLGHFIRSSCSFQIDAGGPDIIVATRRRRCPDFPFLPIAFVLGCIRM